MKNIMKKQIVYILFLIGFIGFAQKPVSLKVDTTSIRIGEQFNLKISINETQNVILPKLEIKGLEVIDSTKIDTVNDFLVRKYILTGFDSGGYWCGSCRETMSGGLVLFGVSARTQAIDV